MKKNEKKVKSKYGVFNGSNISHEILETEKSLIIHELDEPDFTIEKKTDKTMDKNTMIVDEQVISNKPKNAKNAKIWKWLIVALVVLIAIVIIVILAVKISL